MRKIKPLSLIIDTINIMDLCIIITVVRHPTCVLLEIGLRIKTILQKGESVKPSVFVSLIFFFLTMGTTVGAAEVDAGRELYVQYCSSCHGKIGQGNGPVSGYLKIKVPDLTLLRKNNQGTYPTDEVMSAIDGRRTVRGHGDRKMPVWGEIFRKEAEGGKYAELQALLKAKLIAEYVATLQR
jgi:mono/diheme cytochrome c family protein